MKKCLLVLVLLSSAQLCAMEKSACCAKSAKDCRVKAALKTAWGYTGGAAWHKGVEAADWAAKTYKSDNIDIELPKPPVVSLRKASGYTALTATLVYLSTLARDYYLAKK